MPDAGRQMAAVGVYPADMSDVLSLRAVSATNIIWNTFLRWYVMASFAELPLIQNNWRTAKYRRSGLDLESDSIANWAWDVHFNKPVGPEVALVHGCKDGSLLDVLTCVGVEAESSSVKPEAAFWTDFKEPPIEEKASRVLAAQRKLAEARRK